MRFLVIVGFCLITAPFEGLLATPLESGNLRYELDVSTGENRLIASLQGGKKNARSNSTPIVSRVKQRGKGGGKGVNKAPQGPPAQRGGGRRKGVNKAPQGPLQQRAERLLGREKTPSARECQQVADALERSVTSQGNIAPSHRGRALLLAARLRQRAAHSSKSKLAWVLARETYASVADDKRLPAHMRENASARIAAIDGKYLSRSSGAGVIAPHKNPTPVSGSSPLPVVQPTHAPGTAPPRQIARRSGRKRQRNPPGRVACTGVWLDPGHGGVDSGAVGGRGSKALKESDLVLDLALRVFKLLNKGRLKGKVWMTRKQDETVSLGSRVRTVNKKGGCLFVSMHANSMPANARGAKEVRGIETYYLNPDSKGYQSRLARSENAAGNSNFDLSKYLLADLATRSNLEHSRRLAFLLQKKVMENMKKFTSKPKKSKKKKKIKNQGFRDLGVKPELLYVLLARARAAVLFEGPFLSSKADRALWRQPRVRQAMAQGIVRAICLSYPGGC